MFRIIPYPMSVENLNGFSQNINEIIYTLNKDYEDEEYTLIINGNKAEMIFSNEKGKFYAIQSLNQMKEIYTNTIPDCNIHDKPQFNFRSFMIDCARHFFSVEELKKMIELASNLKLNYFHWHLSDDQGFRIQIDSHPELTEKGSVRVNDDFGEHCKSDKPYSGYYTKNDITEIIDFCKHRYIEVIPEIDMPGHTSAILHVYPKLGCTGENVEVKCRQGIYKDTLCTGKEETLDFIKTLLDELCDIFPGKYFHIGGDEIPDTNTKNCPVCQNKIKEYNLNSGAELRGIFINKVAEYLIGKGKSVIVWNDILKGKNINPDITVQRWMDRDKLSSKQANKGNKLIASDFFPFYADYPYGMHSLKSVYNHKPINFKGLNEIGKNNIIGFEMPLWTEYISNNEKLEYMLLPRLLAFAENVWTLADNKKYDDFKTYTIKYTDYLKQKNYTVAPYEQWDKSLSNKVKDTTDFFLKAYNLRKGNKKNEKY